jgi:hypothetical protein
LCKLIEISSVAFISVMNDLGVPLGKQLGIEPVYAAIDAMPDVQGYSINGLGYDEVDVPFVGVHDVAVHRRLDLTLEKCNPRADDPVLVGVSAQAQTTNDCDDDGKGQPIPLRVHRTLLASLWLEIQSGGFPAG